MSPMTADHLAAQQQSLLQALFGQHEASHQQTLWHSDKPQGKRGLQVYQANAHALAERSLRAAYPVIDMMLGSTHFAALARDLWHCHPPARGDMAHWGEALPSFLASIEALADTPYLADVARVEWALHRVASAADAAVDHASFAHLIEQDATGFTLTLAPSTTVINSPFPVVSLVHSHRHAQPSLAQAAERLRSGVPEAALVWRQGLRPCVTQVAAVETVLLYALLQGLDLPTALDAALASEVNTLRAFDFSRWLTNAVTTGLVVGVQRVACSPPNVNP